MFRKGNKIELHHFKYKYLQTSGFYILTFYCYIGKFEVSLITRYCSECCSETVIHRSLLYVYCMCAIGESNNKEGEREEPETAGVLYWLLSWSAPLGEWGIRISGRVPRAGQVPKLSRRGLFLVCFLPQIRKRLPSGPGNFVRFIDFLSGKPFRAAIDGEERLADLLTLPLSRSGSPHPHRLCHRMIDSQTTYRLHATLLSWLSDWDFKRKTEFDFPWLVDWSDRHWDGSLATADIIGLKEKYD